jgi:hypothetical protein
VRLPPHLLEQAAAQPKGKNFQRLWWPVVALPIIVGLSMWVGRIIWPPSEKPEDGSNVIAVAPIIQMPALSPPGVLPDTETPTALPSDSDASPAEPAAQNIPPPVSRITPPRRSSPSTKPGPTGTVASTTTTHAAHIPTQEVDCAVPASVWTGAMATKLSVYAQRLTRRWDEPEVRTKINGEVKTHQDTIRNSDGTFGTCEKINKDLDNWLKQYANKPSGQS